MFLLAGTLHITRLLENGWIATVVDDLLHIMIWVLLHRAQFTQMENQDHITQLGFSRQPNSIQRGYASVNMPLVGW